MLRMEKVCGRSTGSTGTPRRGWCCCKWPVIVCYSRSIISRCILDGDCCHRSTRPVVSIAMSWFASLGCLSLFLHIEHTRTIGNQDHIAATIASSQNHSLALPPSILSPPDPRPITSPITISTCTTCSHAPVLGLAPPALIGRLLTHNRIPLASRLVGSNFPGQTHCVLRRARWDPAAPPEKPMQCPVAPKDGS